MTTPRSLPGEVASELLALHWSSHAKGATVPELSAALKLRRVDASAGDVAVTLGRLSAVGGCAPSVDRRDGWVVWLPTESTPVDASHRPGVLCRALMACDPDGGVCRDCGGAA